MPKIANFCLRIQIQAQKCNFKPTITATFRNDHATPLQLTVALGCFYKYNPNKLPDASNK